MSAVPPMARVGPNAITQLSAVLEERRGKALADAVFDAGGLLELRRPRRLRSRPACAPRTTCWPTAFRSWPSGC